MTHSTVIRPGASRSITVADGILAAAGRTPEKVALRDGPRALTYARLAERIVRVANLAHHGLGLAKGERVAVLSPNRLEYIELVCGLSLAGLAVVTIGPASPPPEIAFLCDDAEARALFVAPELADAAEAAGAATVRTIIRLDDDDYEARLDRASTAPCPVDVDERDIFSIPYTSGSTGKPKGVLLSHRARVLMCYAMGVEHGCYGPDDRAIATTPMFHGAGFLMALVPVFFGGTCEILRRFDIERLLGAISDLQATSAYMVPSHLHALLALGPSVSRFDLRSLKAVISGTAPLAQETKAAVIPILGEGRLYERYGSTEASIVCGLRPADQLRKHKCVGLPFPGTHVGVVDADGAPVPAGAVGELFSCSPYMFSGYLNRPEATEAAMRGEWFSAGDQAILDEEGFVYLVGRKNDMIITGGENVYPREIEEILLEHDGVVDVAVVGVPHPYWGEAVTAFVVTRDGAPVPDEALAGLCRERVARYKAPKAFHRIDALPRNSMNKVARRDLVTLGTRLAEAKSGD